MFYKIYQQVMFIYTRRTHTHTKSLYFNQISGCEHFETHFYYALRISCIRFFPSEFVILLFFAYTRARFLWCCFFRLALYVHVRVTLLFFTSCFGWFRWADGGGGEQLIRQDACIRKFVCLCVALSKFSRV